MCQKKQMQMQIQLTIQSNALSLSLSFLTSNGLVESKQQRCCHFSKSPCQENNHFPPCLISRLVSKKNHISPLLYSTPLSHFYSMFFIQCYSVSHICKYECCVLYSSKLFQIELFVLCSKYSRFDFSSEEKEIKSRIKCPQKLWTKIPDVK